MDAVSFIAPQVPIQPLSVSAIDERGTAGAATGSGFARLVAEGLQQLNDRLNGTEQMLHRMAAGDIGEIHEAMLRLEESRLSFQLMLQVRNRLLEACQDLLRMQV